MEFQRPPFSVIKMDASHRGATPRKTNGAFLARFISDGNTVIAIFRHLLLAAAVLMLVIVVAMIFALAAEVDAINPPVWFLLIPAGMESGQERVWALPFISARIVSSLIDYNQRSRCLWALRSSWLSKHPDTRAASRSVGITGSDSLGCLRALGIFVLPLLRVHVEPPLRHWFGCCHYLGADHRDRLAYGGIISPSWCPIISAVVA